MFSAQEDTTGLLENRTEFLNAMVLSVADTLRHNLGADYSETVIAQVAHRIGDIFNDHFQLKHNTTRLSVEQVAEALVELKRRIDGGYRIVEISEDRIVLYNSLCPFGSGALGRPELCKMTSGVFGRIASENLGYARVDVRSAITRGDRECRVVIDLVRDCPAAADAASGERPVEPIEYYGSKE